MAKKKLIPTDGFGNATNNKLPAYKPKSKIWVEGAASRRVRLERERHLWKIATTPEAKQEHLEYGQFIKEQWRKQDEKN